MKKIVHKTKGTEGFLIEITEDNKAYVLFDNKVQQMEMRVLNRWYNMVDVELEKINEEPKEIVEKVESDVVKEGVKEKKPRKKTVKKVEKKEEVVKEEKPKARKRTKKEVKKEVEKEVEEKKVEEAKEFGKPETLSEYSSFGYIVRNFMEKYASMIGGEIKDNRKHTVIRYGGFNITEVHFQRLTAKFYFNGSCLVSDELKEICTKLDYGWVMNTEYVAKSIEDLELIRRLLDTSVFYRAKQQEERDKRNKEKKK